MCRNTEITYFLLSFSILMVCILAIVYILVSCPTTFDTVKIQYESGYRDGLRDVMRELRHLHNMSGAGHEVFVGLYNVKLRISRDKTQLQSGYIRYDLYTRGELFAGSDTFGRIYYSDGSMYVGAFKHGLPHGAGTYIRDNHVICGHWKSGRVITTRAC